MGIISAIGTSVADCRAALVSGRSGIVQPNGLLSRYTHLPAGRVSLTDNQLKEQLGITDASVNRTTLLALHALNQAVAQADLTSTDLAEPGSALIVASTIGGVSLTDEIYQNGHGDGADATFLNAYGYSSVADYLQRKLNIGGVTDTINTACSSSANAIIYGYRLLKNGFARRAIVGGADCLSKFTVNGFNALRILSDEPCRSFDANRKGLNLGEGAAFLILEREEDLAGKPVLAWVSGYGNANDAFHPSSLSAEGNGPFMAMQTALNVAGLQPEDIGYINAHGTGTENNDEAESQAMLRLFGRPPAFASTKTFTGHTLGAANAIETAFSILSLQHGEVYANLNFSTPAEPAQLTPVTEYYQTDLQHVMSNSFGFGGNCTSVIVSRA
ncbi:3-oxoacyl-(acyl-carrier-protein) synthase [Mucilaginibacter yixingensis]|uniref:3-oxoacyl-(Acyl-carrier-protein) synthase n=2 Tax=Mucilaginibacter yixingensis TaxID=1295612 RepID=A0A2T5JD40_9SPHI|nr:3-oxoacyl-(acyl-carrier-protein) synthase [Mucilaginibacter yixingensis]